MPTTIAAVDPPPSVSAPEANPARGSITFEESTRAAPIAPEPQVQPPSVERLDRRGLPEITILRTAWHPEPARRSARIRMEATDEVINLKEGDAVDQFVIQTISPSAVLFKIGDIEIRRRVGQP